MRIEKLGARDQQCRNGVRFFDQDLATRLAFQKRDPWLNRPDAIELLLFEQQQLIRICGRHDLRIAANEAKLGLPEPGLGLLPGGGGTQRLTWIAGPAVAARIILTAEAVDGKTARELGMVQWAVPRADLEAEARKLAQKVAGLHPLSLAACKVCLRLARDPERNGFAAETEWTGRLLGTQETQKRVADFLAGARR